MKRTIKKKKDFEYLEKRIDNNQLKNTGDVLSVVVVVLLVFGLVAAIQNNIFMTGLAIVSGKFHTF